MRPPSLAGLVHVGLDILSTTISAVTNKITAQTGDAIRQSTDASDLEWWQHVGFASRPAKPIAGKSAAQCVVLKTSDRDAAIASQDVRGLAIYGNLKHGETCCYGAGEDGLSQGRAFFKDDGSVTLLTTNDNTPTGKVVALKLAPDAFTFTAPWGSFKFDATGFHMKVKSGGSRIDIGGMDLSSLGIPTAITDQLTGYITLTAAKINLKGGVCTLGLGPSYATCLAAPSAALAPGSPLAGQPVLTGPTSQCSTVRISTP